MIAPMTSIERIENHLKHKPVDRIGVSEEFWSFTIDNWVKQGKMPKGVSAGEHFNHDIETTWAFDLQIEPGKGAVLIAEDEDTKTFLDGNGAKLRRHKSHDSTPEHIGYAINSREDWEEMAKPFLKPDKKRLHIDWYRDAMERSKAHQRFLCWGGVNVFEAIHPVCGHENMLMGMALDPDWIVDMCNTYTDMIICMMEELFDTEGAPNGIWFFEDMGFKERPFMSPDMYRELIMPSHRRTCEFAHSRNLPVIMHSCGFVEPLLPDMIEAGIDCLQAIEVKAGMDLLRIYEAYGDKIALMGGIDVRPVASNDFEGIRRELELKLPVVTKKHGFILHSDHSIPESTEYDTYRYFLELGREIGSR